MDDDRDQGPHVVWEPQPRQSLFITCPAHDVGFGGARGGGKSDAVIGDWLSHEDLYGSSAIGMAFRRTRTHIGELIERAKQVLRPLGHVWHEQDKYFRGPRGGRLRFTYLERDADADAYQGHSYTRLYPEEIGTFPSETPINKLQATLRSGAGVPCQMKSTCNPGGVGHQWVMRRYRLDEFPRGGQLFRFQFENPFTKEKIERTRVFIPSRVHDNKFLDSSYVGSLYQAGSPALVRAWLEGDWSVIEGAYFPEWSTDRHVVEPFEIPIHWARFRAMDWGSYRPFCVLWFAIASEDHRVAPGLTLPRGGMVVYREWYGASAPNIGLKLSAKAVGEGIRDRERGDKLTHSVIDPSAYIQDGGPSIAEMLYEGGAEFMPADNSRLAGWNQIRQRLLGEGDDRPMLVVAKTCTNLIRTLPALQHDERKPEDVDTDAEDHAPDTLRYGCMSRPWAIDVEKKKPPKFLQVGEGNEVTLNELFEQNARKPRQRFM